MAQVHLSNPEYSQYKRSADENDEIDDIETLGIEKFRSILNIEARKNLASRFIWGSMSTKIEDPDTSNQPDQDTLNQHDEITILT
jgi:nitric oxide reductase large subunit